MSWLPRPNSRPASRFSLVRTCGRCCSRPTARDAQQMRTRSPSRCSHPSVRYSESCITCCTCRLPNDLYRGALCHLCISEGSFWKFTRAWRVCATTAITLSRVRATQELPVNHHHREPPTNHPGATLSMVSTGCDLRCLVKKRCWVGMDPLPL